MSDESVRNLGLPRRATLERNEGPKVCGATLQQEMLEALIALREALRTLPGIDPFSHGPLAEADSLAEAAIERAWKEHAAAALAEHKRERRLPGVNLRYLKDGQCRLVPGEAYWVPKEGMWTVAISPYRVMGEGTARMTLFATEDEAIKAGASKE